MALTFIKLTDKDKNSNQKGMFLCSGCNEETEQYIIGLRTNNPHSASQWCFKCGIAQRKLNKHSDSRTKLYKMHTGMKQRCFNSNNNAYYNYGGRGITVCNEWIDYSVFKEWALNNGYIEGLTIERINNDSNYEPNNCTFITRQENLMNRRTSILNRFTQEEINNMIEEYINTSISLQDTAFKYKISMSSIYRLLNGRTKNTEREEV